MELSGTNIKKFLIYFYISEIPKKNLIFQVMELSYISRNQNPKKLRLFQEINFLAPSLKKFLYFRNGL